MEMIARWNFSSFSRRIFDCDKKEWRRSCCRFFLTNFNLYSVGNCDKWWRNQPIDLCGFLLIFFVLCVCCGSPSPSLNRKNPLNILEIKKTWWKFSIEKPQFFPHKKPHLFLKQFVISSYVDCDTHFLA